MSDKQFNIAIVGLGFGAEFIPIHQAHPNANLIAVCRRNEAEMNAVADQFNIEKRYTDYDELLKDPEIDAVHINTPIPHHAEATLQAMGADITIEDALVVDVTGPDLERRRRRQATATGPARAFCPAADRCPSALPAPAPVSVRCMPALPRSG